MTREVFRGRVGERGMMSEDEIGTWEARPVCYGEAQGMKSEGSDRISRESDWFISTPEAP